MPGFELIGDEERAAVSAVFDDGGVLFAHGFDATRAGRYRVREFERQFAEWMGVPHALCVSSGTAALKTGLIALGIGPGDEVITQAFTFVATVEAIIETGAKPIIVNVDETLNMDPAELERAIGPRTKAIVPVHMLGVAAAMDAIAEVAARHGVVILEDNCESLGAEWHGAKLSAQGHSAAFSLDFGKVITCGEGGIFTTADDEVAALAYAYSDHGHDADAQGPRGLDTPRIRGFNLRMTELQAAVATAQLGKLDSIVATNRRNHAILADALSDIDRLQFRLVPEPCTPLCDTLVISLPSEALAASFVAAMAESQLGTKNIPDALIWHFAGHWTHLCSALELTEAELSEATEPSRRLLSRSVAVPVMVREPGEQLAARAEQLRRIAEATLG